MGDGAMAKVIIVIGIVFGGGFLIYGLTTLLPLLGRLFGS